jgi:imidazolonepropionase-like amidohydrolase
VEGQQEKRKAARRRSFPIALVVSDKRLTFLIAACRFDKSPTPFAEKSFVMPMSKLSTNFPWPGATTCLIVLLLATVPLWGDEILFQEVRVFDGTELLPATNVLVRDGKIAEIGEEITSDSAELISGRGKTLLPGFIDCHVHAFFPAQLQQAATFGTTTVLDMMSIPRMAALYRQQQADGKSAGRADFYSAGAAVTVVGGHGTQFGFQVPTLNSAEEADQFVADRMEEGSDYIKIIYDDGAAYSMDLPTLDEPMLAAAIKATHDRGKMAVAHIGSREGARLLISLGVDGLVHGFADAPIDDELIALAKEKEVFIVPTMVVTKMMREPPEATAGLLDDPAFAPFVNPMIRTSVRTRFPGSDRFKVNFAHMIEAIGKLHQAGVPILAGTDAPNPGTAHGISLHQELDLLVEAGLTPLEALASTTSVAAQHFQLEDRGHIAVGKIADLVLVDGDPTDDIRVVRKIVNVWKSGKLVKRVEVPQDE